MVARGGSVELLALLIVEVQGVGDGIEVVELPLGAVD
jgi:hypothetical protein